MGGCHRAFCVEQSSTITLRPVWITFQCYNFSVVAVAAIVVAVVAVVVVAVVAVVAVVVAAVVAAICSKTAVNGQLSLLKSYPNSPYC